MYFYDTYALVEIVKGAENYRKYANYVFNTSIFHVFELFYSMLEDFGEDAAVKTLKKLNLSIVQIREEDIVEASKFRLKNKKKRLSYADCIGYALSKSNGMVFLTGDKEFKDMENVEFVK